MARAEAQQPHSGNAGFRVLPLLTAVALIALLTVYPHIATDNAGAADHLTAMLLLWSMSAGLVCGVGFLPRHVLPRLILSGSACFIALALAVLRIAIH